MIAPRSRLLQWTALVVVPIGLFIAAVPESLPMALTALGLLLCFVLVDAALSHRTLEGLAVEVPGLIRLSKDRPAELEVRIRNESGKARHLRLGLALPTEFYSPQEELSTVLPVEATLARVPWHCVPLQRGRFLLNRAYLESNSPLGFWVTRTRADLQSELRVYPNVLGERKRVAALFLHRGTFGLHQQRQVGKGRQFEGLRDYVPGDSSEDIHWKATAKRGRPVTKLFEIERTHEVYVVIDAARLSARICERQERRPASDAGVGANPRAIFEATPAIAPMPAASILERFISSALLLGLAAEQQGDLFGLVTFSDRVHRFVRARNGREHYNSCREALFTLQPQMVTPDFEELASFLRLRLRRRALLVFLTALDDPILAESFVKSLDLLTRQHLLLVNMMQPPGAQPLFSNPNVSSLDDLYAELGGHLLWHDLRELGKVLGRRGVRFSLLEHETMSAELSSQYLSVKQRQLL
jgi:uncharacterized protein (DUF58 family)